MMCKVPQLVLTSCPVVQTLGILATDCFPDSHSRSHVIGTCFCGCSEYLFQVIVTLLHYSPLNGMELSLVGSCPDFIKRYASW